MSPPRDARLVVAERTFPTGMLGHYARTLAQAGLLAVVTATSPPRLGPPDTTEARRQLHELLEGYPVKIDVVGTLPGTLAGKHRWIVSDLAEQRFGLRNAPVGGAS